MTDSSLTGVELRRLRYRLGWSRAEMARNLNIELTQLSFIETARVEIPAGLRANVVRISQTADANAESTQRRALAETLMDRRGLAQIHNFDCDADCKDFDPKGASLITDPKGRA